MPNWCDTSYTIVGEEKEINTLYGIMKKLQDMKEPSVNNGFGTSWLGCLVDAFGGRLAQGVLPWRVDGT